MNIYLIIIVCLLVGEYLLHLLVDVANLKHVETEIPGEFEGWYDAEKYRKSQDYLRDTTRFDVLRSTVLMPLTLAFILLGGFRMVDDAARASENGLVLTGLYFAGMLILLFQLANLPFSIYSTFVLEERYGFNRTKPLTFVVDFIKELMLIAIIGGIVLAGLIWFFSTAGEWAWLTSWIALVVVQFLLIYIAPIVILPLFNTFTPLEDGELKESISSYAHGQGFSLKGIFTMDGSKRSTKSNAYFTGFGRWRRIVLFDTLVQKHSVNELVSILAHEVGHYKLRHIRRMLVTSILSTGVMFFILSLFITRPGLYGAFGLEMIPIDGRPPVYAGLIFFGFLYTPISILLGLLQNVLSRKHEYEADAFAVETCGEPDAMIEALKKLTVDNLSDLSPHPLKVFLEYSHPPILQRIEAIRGLPSST
jgi:STE24 endopeptidase